LLGNAPLPPQPFSRPFVLRSLYQRIAFVPLVCLPPLM
jgi:hypothetical protein